MSKKDTRGRKNRTDNVRVVPELREQIDIEKLCHALIEIAKRISRDNAEKIWRQMNKSHQKCRF